MVHLPKIRAFYRFFLSYVLILAIPLVISCFMYREMLRIVEFDEKESNLVLLEKVKNTLDDRLIEIGQMVNTLGNDRYVKRFARLKKLEGSAFYDLYYLVRHLAPYRNRNKIIHTLYIYFRKSNRIVMTNASYEMESFYNDYHAYGDMNYTRWKKVFLEDAHNKDLFPSTAVNLGPDSFNMLTYIASFPRVYKENPTFVIWVFIDEKEIKQLLSNISSKGWVYILNKSGQNMVTLSETGDIPRIDIFDFNADKGFLDSVIEGERMIISYTTSSYDGMKFVSVEPYRTVMSKTHFMRWLMIGIGLAIMFLGLITAYVLALGSTRPLKELVQLFRERKRTGERALRNEYDFIEKNVREILDRNESLQKEMDEQIPMLRTAFFGRLLKGEYTKDSDINSLLYHLGINIDVRGDFYSVVIVRIDMFYNELSNSKLNALFTIKAVIKQIIVKKYPRRCLYVYDRAEDELVLLFRFQNSETDKYRDVSERILQEIYTEFSGDYKISLFFSAGSLCSRLKDIWHSFREAIEASEAIRITDEFRISWYEEQNQSYGNYYYPLDLEERLLNNVKAGNEEEVAHILSMIYRENIENRNLSSKMLQLLINSMRCSAIRILNLKNLKSDKEVDKVTKQIENMRRYESFDSAFKALKRILESISSIIDRQKKSHKRELVERIKAYILKYCNEKTLNRVQVADEFSMTEEYFSLFFKEQAGINFSDHLEELRLMKACELLSRSEVPITSIASSIGYGSQKAFSRAFKRVNGINPSEYRKNEVDLLI